MPDEKDSIINAVLFQPTDRQCMFCHDKFKGLRDFCDKEQCRKDGVAFIASRRGSYLRDNYGLIDYQSVARKTFLVENLPDFPIIDDLDKKDSNDKDD